MEDSNLWYYLVLGIIYLISRAFGKKKPKKGVPHQPMYEEDETHRESVPDLSFEDLLRELTGEKRKASPPPPPVVESKAYEPVKKQQTYIEPSPAYSVDAMDAIASEPLKPTSVIDGIYDDEISRKRMASNFTRDTKYKIQEFEPVDFTEILTEENGPAQAFVAHEIFARKF